MSIGLHSGSGSLPRRRTARSTLPDAFDQGAAYYSPNYLCFRQRYRRFVYVDRVVVAPAARGRGYAACCHGDLFDRPAGLEHRSSARSIAIPDLLRMAFPAIQGFAEVGRGHDPRAKIGPFLAGAIER